MGNQTGGPKNSGADNKAPWTAKRVAAVIGIVLLAGLYVLTFVSALIGTESVGRLFRFSLGMTVAVPIFLWIFIWCVGKMSGRHNMASLDILSSNKEEREKMERAVQEEMERAKREETERAVQKETE